MQRRDVQVSVSTEAELSHDTRADGRPVPSWQSQVMLRQLWVNDRFASVWAVMWGNKGTWGREQQKFSLRTQTH